MSAPSRHLTPPNQKPPRRPAAALLHPRRATCPARRLPPRRPAEPIAGPVAAAATHGRVPAPQPRRLSLEFRRPLPPLPDFAGEAPPHRAGLPATPPCSLPSPVEMRRHESSTTPEPTSRSAVVNHRGQIRGPRARIRPFSAVPASPRHPALSPEFPSAAAAMDREEPDPATPSPAPLTLRGPRLQPSSSQPCSACLLILQGPAQCSAKPGPVGPDS